MFQKFKVPVLLLIVLSFVLIACQKQDAINQPPTPKTNLAAMARTDSKDYRIHEDTAAAWATRFEQLNSTKLGNKMPAIITLPNNGILQLQAEAAAHGVKLLGIAMHFSVKEDGTIGIFYTPVGMDGIEIKTYGREDNFSPPRRETYDGTGPCGGAGGPCIIMGGLNTPSK